MSEKVVFKLNKKNIICILLILFLLIIAGALFIFYPSIFTSSLVRSELWIKICGTSICLFSIPLFIGYFVLLFDDNGLIVSKNGMINNTNLLNSGQVEWRDITSIRIKKIKKNTFFLIFVKDERKYFGNRNLLKKINAFGYRSMYGTSIVIETKNLLCSLEEVKSNLNKYVRFK